MEVCGGQTHSIVKHGIERLLPDGIELVHGPGCPVCVTPLETIDKAHAIAARPEVSRLEPIPKSMPSSGIFSRCARKRRLLAPAEEATRALVFLFCT